MNIRITLRLQICIHKHRYRTCSVISFSFQHRTDLMPDSPAFRHLYTYKYTVNIRTVYVYVYVLVYAYVRYIQYIDIYIYYKYIYLYI